MVTEETRNKVDNIIKRILKNSTTSCGEPYKLYFAIMNNLESPDSIGDITENILRRYTPIAPCDSGVIFLLSKLDRKMYIYSGEVSLSTFNACRREVIFDLAKIPLKTDKFDEALIIVAN